MSRQSLINFLSLAVVGAQAGNPLSRPIRPAAQAIGKSISCPLPILSGTIFDPQPSPRDSAGRQPAMRSLLRKDRHMFELEFNDKYLVDVGSEGNTSDSVESVHREPTGRRCEPTGRRCEPADAIECDFNWSDVDEFSDCEYSDNVVDGSSSSSEIAEVHELQHGRYCVPDDDQHGTAPSEPAPAVVNADAAAGADKTYVDPYTVLTGDSDEDFPPELMNSHASIEFQDEADHEQEIVNPYQQQINSDSSGESSDTELVIFNVCEFSKI